ncbi:MAG: Radical SAM domain protein [Parcubacteria group bacterium Licking1014_17]|nr:MAG: Radical SAM domain protein [Parcubacteria group bacterium Licking1014_17]
MKNKDIPEIEKMPSFKEREFDVEELKNFLKGPAKQMWAIEAPEITPQRPGYKELKHIDGDWCLRDSYTGYFQAPGMSTLYYKGELAWTISYGGKMHEEHYEKTKPTFKFLKLALRQENRGEADDLPVRGPTLFEDGDWRYEFKYVGDLKCFSGKERIFFKGAEVFFQDVIGGLVIPKK